MVRAPEDIDFVTPGRCRICGARMLRLAGGASVPGKPWKRVLDACFGDRPWVYICPRCDIGEGPQAT